MNSGLLRSAMVACALSLAGMSSSTAAQAGCDRACLEGFVDRYLDAVAVNQPSMVPLSPNVRFTEDGQRLLIGDGLWNTMKGKGNYRNLTFDDAGRLATLLAEAGFTSVEIYDRLGDAVDADGNVYVKPVEDGLPTEESFVVYVVGRR